jgi:hypothetical protein
MFKPAQELYLLCLGVIGVDPPMQEMEICAGAVEVRNELGKALGAELPGTLVFDYPTAYALAAYIAAMTSATGDMPTAVMT